MIYFIELNQASGFPSVTWANASMFIVWFSVWSFGVRLQQMKDGQDSFVPSHQFSHQEVESISPPVLTLTPELAWDSFDHLNMAEVTL